MSSRSTTPAQDRVARRERNTSLLSEFAKNPDTPRLLGGIARLEAWRQRPRNLERRLAVGADARLARIHEADRILTESRAVKLAKVLADYRKQQAHQQSDATPDSIPASLDSPQILPPPTDQPISGHSPSDELSAPQSSAQTD